MVYLEDTTNFKIKNSVICLGKFDGLHKGHKKLINYIKDFADKDEKTVIFTFANHPTVFFSNNKMKLIDSKNERRRKLIETGVDVIIEYPFNKKIASMEPQNFIEEVLVKKLDAKCIVVGEDYHFGNHQKGDAKLLKEYGKKYGYYTVIIPKLCLYNKQVSSSRIRKEISEGNMDVVKDLLGENYKIQLRINKVINNNGSNTIICLNSVSKDKLYPPKGKYLVTIIVNKKRYIAKGTIRYINDNNISMSIILDNLDKGSIINKENIYVGILKKLNELDLECC